MKKFFFAIFFWTLGVVGEERVEDRIAARGKCREISVEENVVKIKFSNIEDAEIFAKDLNEFINR